MGKRHIRQSSYSMEWCEWVNVTFNHLVIPWNGVNRLTSHSTIFIPWNGVNWLTSHLTI